MATQVYYSVCPFGTGNLLSGGSPTIVVDSSGNATLTLGGATQATNIGQGVCVEYNSRVSYIDSITDATHFHLVTALGANAAEQGSTACTSIHHVWASLSAGEAAADDAAFINNASLTAADVVLNLCCYYDHVDYTTDNEACEIAGWTADSTRYVKIFTPRGMDFNESLYSQRHEGVWDSEKYIISHTNASGGIVNNANSYTVIEGLQVENPYTGTSTNRYAIGSSSTSYINATVRDCIAKATGAGSYTKGIYLTGPSHQVINCIAYGFALEGIYASNGTANAGSCYILNCTAYSCGLGICSSSANYRTYKTYAYNCTSFGCGTSDYGNPAGNWHASSSNNASEDGTAPGTDIDLSSYTASQIWTDAANGDFSLVSGSPLIGEGTDLSAYFTTDIIGTTRSSWDIGAFEYVASGGGGVSIIPIIMNHLQKMRAN